MLDRSMKMQRQKAKVNNLPVKIIFVLYRSKIPLSLSMIANACKTPRQKANYHLVTLVSKGIILYDAQDKVYRIQPCLKDNSYIEKLEPLVSSIATAINASQSDLLPDEIVFNILECYLQLHIIEV